MYSIRPATDRDIRDCVKLEKEVLNGSVAAWNYSDYAWYVRGPQSARTFFYVAECSMSGKVVAPIVYQYSSMRRCIDLVNFQLGSDENPVILCRCVFDWLCRNLTDRCNRVLFSTGEYENELHDLLRLSGCKLSQVIQYQDTEDRDFVFARSQRVLS